MKIYSKLFSSDFATSFQENFGLPFYRQVSEQHKKIGLVVAIALSCLVFSYLLIRCYPLLNIFKIKEKETKNPEVEKTEPIDAKENELPTKVLELSKTQGIVNGGNTCYLASCLQSVKNMRAFWNYLDEAKHPLIQKDRESNEVFELRKSIRKQVSAILTKSNEGILVTGKEINQLREVLHQFKPKIIHPTEGTEALEAWLVLAEALQIPIPSYLMTRGNESRIVNWDLGVIGVCENMAPVKTAIENIKFETLTDILPIHMNRLMRSNNNVAVEFPMELQLKCKGEVLNYRLVSLTNASPSHSWAYLRDNQTDSWIIFNDSSVKSNATIDENVKQKLRTLFYERY